LGLGGRVSVAVRLKSLDIPALENNAVLMTVIENVQSVLPRLLFSNAFSNI
jgi:hypothetical protein